MSYLDPQTSEYSGFEIEIAKALAEELGFPPEDRVEWVPIENLPERETVLGRGEAHLVVANFSVTPDRERYVDFAGPYQLVPQAVMVRKDRTVPLETIADLRVPGVRVCAPTGSTSAAALEQQRIATEPVDTNLDCMIGLDSGEYDAFSTDLPILAGFLSENEEGFEILDLTIADHDEEIAVAVPEGDHALRDLIRHFLNRWQQGSDHANPWLRAYDQTIGRVLGPDHRAQPRIPNPPVLADFDSRAPRT